MKEIIKKMRIGFITPQISLQKGGIQSLSMLFAQTFPELIGFHTYCAKDSDSFDGAKTVVTYSKYSQKQTIRLHFDLIKHVIRDHRDSRFDFTFSSLYSYCLPCFILKKLKGIPYGVMVHGNELMKEPKRRTVRGRLIATLKKRLRLTLLLDAEIVFANSEYTQKLCVNSFGTSNVVVIHPPIKYIDKHIGVDLCERRYVLLSIGRLTKRKGFQYVIEAMKTLVNDFPLMNYYIVGSGQYEKELKQTIETNNLQEHVFLLGMVSEEEKDRLYQECDFFIMPSYTIDSESEVEGFGIVYIEANMYGKYVIATRSGGIPDAVIEGVTGSFVETQNAQSIYMLLRKLYSNDFVYSPNKCVEWSRKMDVKNIALQYLDAFSKSIEERELN